MKAKKVTALDQIFKKREEAFYKKMEEYDKLSLEELKDLYNHPEKKKRPGGIYKQALVEVVRKKQIALASETIKEGTEEIKQEEPKEDTIQ